MAASTTPNDPETFLGRLDARLLTLLNAKSLVEGFEMRMNFSEMDPELLLKFEAKCASRPVAFVAGTSSCVPVVTHTTKCVWKGVEYISEHEGAERRGVQVKIPKSDYEAGIITADIQDKLSHIARTIRATTAYLLTLSPYDPSKTYEFLVMPMYVLLTRMPCDAVALAVTCVPCF